MKHALLLSALILTACTYDTSALTAPAVRAGIANGNSTATVEARNDAQISIALTAIPPAQTSTALAIEALSLAATRRSGEATATQMGIDYQSTGRAATATQSARLTATQAPIVAEMTAQAGAESLLRFNQNQQIILTQSAGKAQFEAAKYGALELAVYVFFPFAALALGIVILAFAFRIGGPEIISLGEGLSRVIIARANSYSTRTLANNYGGGEIEPPATSIGAGENWHVARWKQAAWLFLMAGDKYGFTIRALGSAGERVVTDPGWEQMKNWLIDDLHILADNNGTEWAEGWDMARFRAGYPAWNPTPPPGQPPTVAAVVRGATTLQRSTTHSEGG